MGTSFIEYKEYGFWTPDGLIEGLLFMLSREFKKIEKKEDWHNEIINEWILAASGIFNGWVQAYLDKYFVSQKRLKLLKETLNYIISQLQSNDTFLTLSDLNENKIGQGVWLSVKRENFVIIAQLMIHLIDGKLKITSESPINYWNFD